VGRSAPQLKCYVENMKKHISVFLFFLPLVAHAESCISDFNEKLLFSEIINGKQIKTPFKHGYLIDGQYEPELKREYIDKESLSKVLKLQYGLALSRGSEKLIKNENGVTSVIYRGPSSGYNTEYIFKNLDGCWHLVEFTDWST
jgi:hypothetical protein